MSNAAVQSDKPQVVARIGASYLKVIKAKRQKESKELETTANENKDSKNKKDTKRGRVSKFSYKSRVNLIRTLAQVKRDALPSFVTLTYPKEFPFEAERWKRDLDTFIKRLNRAFPGVCGIWKLEPQQRGAPHYHVIVWGVSCSELQAFVPQAWYEIAGDGNYDHYLYHIGAYDSSLHHGDKYHNKMEHCVQPVRSAKAMYIYVAKYMAKDIQEAWGNVGRWWGIFFRDRIPFGEEVIFDTTDKRVIEMMRYFRRFAHIKSRNYSSLILICDVGQWLEKMQTIPIDGYKQWLERLQGAG